MQTKTYNVYKFDELSEDAKQKAIENYSESEEYFWHDENVKSLKAFCDFYNLCMPNFEYGYRHYFIDEDDTIINFDEHKKLESEGKCPLTGYCMDDVLILELNKSGNVNDAFIAWLDACKQDFEYTYSDEGITETLIANDYDFKLDGSID
jgi:hypothetical protein